MTSYPVPIPSRYYSNIVGLQLNEHTFDILGHGLTHVAQFGSTLPEMDMRLFIRADENYGYGLKVSESNQQPVLNIGYWDCNTKEYRTQILLDPGTGINFTDDVVFPGNDLYFSGNLGVGTSGPIARVHLAGYKLDVNGSFYATGTVYASNLVVYGDSVILETTTCNTEQMIITNAGTGPALIVTQEGRGTEYAIAEFRDLDESNVALIIADGGNVGIGTKYPSQPLDVRGTVVISDRLGIGTTLPQSGFQVYEKDATFTNNLGIGTTLPRSPLDVIGIASVSTNIGIGTTIPLGALHVELAPSFLRPNVGIGTTLPRQALHIEGSTYVTSSIGIGTTTPRQTLDVVGPYAIISNNLGIGTTTPRKALDVVGEGVVTANLGVGTTSPRRLLDVQGDIITSTNLGIGTTAPRVALDVVGEGIVTANVGIGTTGPRKTLDVVGDAIVSMNIGIGTTLPLAPLHIEEGPIFLSHGNLGIGTLSPTDALHVTDSMRIANKRFSYRLPLSTSSQTIQFFKYQYTSFAPFYIRVHGQVHSGYNSIYVDVHFGGRYGYGVRTKHASIYGELTNLVGQSVSSSFQIKFCKRNGVTDEYQGFLVLNEGASENIGIDLSFDVHDGEDTFIWSASSIPPDFSLYWNATQDAQMIEYNTYSYQRDPIGIGTDAPDAWLNVKGLASVALPIIQGQALNTDADYLSLLNPTNISVFKVANTTNVGVGTGSPAYKLDVYGNTHIQTILQVDQSVGIGTFAPHKALDVRGDIISSTNVGIGTTSPRKALDVIGAGIVTGNVGIGTSSIRKTLDVVGDIITSTNVGVGTTLPRHSLHTEQTSYLRGNVGIGTYAPLVLLSVGSGPTDTSSTSAVMLNSGDTSTGMDKLYLTYVTNGSRIAHAGGWNVLMYAGQSNVGSQNGNFRFFTGGSVYNEQLTIRNSGFVGIGSSEPRKHLDVMGDIITPTNIGIGTTTPRKGLDVIGTGIFTSQVGVGTITPRKDLDIVGTAIISFSVGVGITTPRKALDVIGDIIVTTNIGVGTTTPRFELDVVGSGILQTSLGIGTTLAPRKALDVVGDIIMTRNIGVGTTTPRHALDVMGSGVLQTSLGIGTTLIPRKALDVVGDAIVSTNIGIGTTAPRAQLDVIGGVLHGNLGIGTTTVPLLPLAIYDTSAILIPRGTTDERPLPAPQHGFIRYNTTTEQFEGFGAGDQWGSLGGVKDINGDTYVSAELSPGTNDDVLRFINSNVETMRIQRDGNVGIGTQIALTKLMVLTPADYSGDTIRVASKASPNTHYWNFTAKNPVTDVMTYHISTANSGPIYDNVVTIDGSNIGIGTERARQELDVIGTAIFTANMGIGTVTPRKKLDVIGDAILSSTVGIQTTQARKSLDVIGDAIVSVNIGVGTTLPRQALHVEGMAYISTNVGVGTAMPMHTLDVNGSTRIGTGLDSLHIMPGKIYDGATSLTQQNAVWLGLPGTGTVSLSDHVILNGGNLGLGTVAPASLLAVSGGGVIGSNYMGLPAPAQGLVVQGNMGIGTTIPRKELDVNGTVLASTSIGIGTSTPRKALDVIGVAIVSANVGIGTTIPLNLLQVQGDGYFTGKVGIATTYPQADIHVGTSVPLIKLEGTTNGNLININDSSYLRFGSDQSFKTHVLVVADNFAGGPQGRINFRYKNYIGFDVINGVSGIGVEKARFDGSGNLGIGTASPRQLLDVMGDIITATNIGIGTTTPKKALDVIGDVITTNNIGIGTTTPRKALDVLGEAIISTNVGIGTTAPRAELDVQGTSLLGGNLGIGTTVAKGRVHSVGDINLQAGSVQFMDNDPGTMVEKYYNLGDRYGVGQYSGGTLRAYVSDTNATSTFRISRYKTDGSFTDMVTVSPGGNLGIGLIAPRERVEVAGALRVTDGIIQSKDTLAGMALPQGVVRRKFTHSKVTYPSNGDEMRDYFASGLTFVESVVTSNINQSISVGDNYAYEFIGYIYANVEGTYTFNVNSDDAGEVYIDGKLASDYYGIHGQNDEGNKRTAYLTHGLHSLVLRTQEVAGGDGVILSWRKPGDAIFSTIPAEAYYYDPKDLLFTVQSQLVYTQGNVGIGTLAPRQLLDVQGSVHIACNLGIGTTTPRAHFDVEGNNIVSGALGIGTTIPNPLGANNQFTVYGNGRSYLHGIVITNTSVTQSNAGTALNIATSDSSAIVFLQSNVTEIARFDSRGYLGLSAPNPTNPAERLHVGGNAVMEGNVGIGTTISIVGLSVYKTDSVLIAKGTNAERPTGVKGYIRYNTDLDQFEGFGAGNTWGTLGGVKSSDGLTYISAELNAGTNDSNLRFYTGGVLQAIINPNGNLGIGTTQPQQRLHVQGSTAITASLSIGRTSPREALDVIGKGIFTGNVGIGTTVPRKALDVIGDGIYSANVGIGTLTPRGQLDVEGVAMISQQLGIGTTTPAVAFALDVAGISRFLNPLNVTATKVLIAQDTQSASLSRHSAERMDVGWGDVGGADIEMFSKSHSTRPGELALTYGGSPTMGAVTWNQYNGSTWTVYATLDAKGNLGIGQAPQEKLHVNGKIRAESLLSSRAVFTDENRNLQTGNTSATQIHYLSNLTSDVQAQIDTKFDKAGGNVYGSIDVTSNVYVHETLFASNLRVLGQYTIIETITSNTDQLTILNDGSGPALIVTQSGIEPIAQFIDRDSNIGVLIDNDGYVGIGTESPLQRLHVENSMFVRTSVGVGTTNPRTSLDVIGDIITSTNIGIGTTHPATSLHVWGDIYANSIHFKRSTNAYADAVIQHTPNDDVVFQNTVLDKELFFKTNSVDGSRNIVSIGKLQPEVRILGKTDLIADNAQFIVSGTNSNVGIGTLTPVHKLEVFGVSYTTKLSLTDRSRTLYDINLPLTASIGSHGDDYANIKMPNTGRDLSLSAQTFQVRTDPTGTIGTVQMVVDAQGNVGIGTASPRHRLDVASGNSILYGNVGLGTTEMTVKLEVHSTDSILVPKGNTVQRPYGMKGYIRYNTDLDQFEGFGPGNTWGTLGGAKSTDGLTYITTELYSGANDCNIRFYTSGQQRAIINPLGNVGIGTTLPTVALDLHRVRINNANPYGQILIARELDGDFQHIVEGTGSVGQTTTFRLRNASNTSMELTTSNVRFYTDSLTDEKVRIDYLGNLGIGTTSPKYKLHVQGESYLHSNVRLGAGILDSNSYLMLHSSDTTSAPMDKIYLTHLQNGSKIGHSTGWNVHHYAGQDTVPASSSNGNFHFYTGATSYTERLTILNNGNIGIGTTAPRASLELFKDIVIPYGNLGIGTTTPLSTLDTDGSLIVRQGNVGIGTTQMSLRFEIWDSKAMLIPAGTNAERPSSNIQKGYVRYNTTTDQFEGFGAGNQWGTLGGVKDVDGDTYISAELAPATNDDNLRFITSNIEKMRIDKNGNVGIGTDLSLGLLNIYDRHATRNTILFNWDSSSGTRYAKVKVPVDSYINPTIFDTNNTWEIQTNTERRITIDDTGIISHNRIFLHQGNSNAPAITFTNDTSTGMYLPSALNLGITTSNQERIRVVADGNVGIGTMSPLKKLQVDGNVHLGASKLGSSTSRAGGPFFKQASWDAPSTNHTIAYAEYCEGDNSAGNLHIQVSNKVETGSAKIGNVMVSFIKRYGDGVNIFTISHHKSPQLTTLSISTSGDNIQVTTDNDCSIAWTSIGAF